MTYSASNVTSSVIQPLIDQGAIIVGKTKLSMLANAYFTAAQWVDYSLPIVCPYSHDPFIALFTRRLKQNTFY
jgi:Asp-tRNA(Asn)/Glu-tRNA(Gln) amidotransferase A subunit family amidase